MQPTNQNPFQTTNPDFNPQPMQDVGPPRPPASPFTQAVPPAPPAQAPNPVSQQQFTQSPAPAQPTPASFSTPPPSNPISVPVTQYSAPAPQPSPVPSRPEVIQSIPVREPNAPGSPTIAQVASAPATANPFSAVQPQSVTGAQDPEDTRIEQILQDVNSAVNKPEAATAQQAKASKKSLKDKIKLPSSKHHKVLVALAVITCLSLSMAAYFAFHQTKTVAFRPGPPMKLVGTSAASSDSIKAGGGTLISPSDIDDFNKNTQSQLDKMNDSGDFDSTPINTQALGL
jgi:hypothetical protein